MLIFLFFISLSFAEENSEWKVAENIAFETIQESDSTKTAVSLAIEELTKWVTRNGGFVNQLRLEVLPLEDGKVTDAQRGLFIKKCPQCAFKGNLYPLYQQIVNKKFKESIQYKNNFNDCGLEEKDLLYDELLGVDPLLLSIPNTIHFTPFSKHHSAETKSAIESIVQETTKPQDLLKEWENLMIVALALEIRNPKSFWKPYFNSIPSLERFGIRFSEKELVLLRFIGNRGNVATKIKTMKDAYIKLKRGKAVSILSDDEILYATQLYQAKLLVQNPRLFENIPQRFFQLSLVPTLVPFIDLLNQQKGDPDHNRYYTDLNFNSSLDEEDINFNTYQKLIDSPNGVNMKSINVVYYAPSSRPRMVEDIYKISNEDFTIESGSQLFIIVNEEDEKDNFIYHGRISKVAFDVPKLEELKTLAEQNNIQYQCSVVESILSSLSLHLQLNDPLRKLVYNVKHIPQVSKAGIKELNTYITVISKVIEQYSKEEAFSYILLDYMKETLSIAKTTLDVVKTLLWCRRVP